MPNMVLWKPWRNSVTTNTGTYRTLSSIWAGDFREDIYWLKFVNYFRKKLQSPKYTSGKEFWKHPSSTSLTSRSRRAGAQSCIHHNRWKLPLPKLNWFANISVNCRIISSSIGCKYVFPLKLPPMKKGPRNSPFPK